MRVLKSSVVSTGRFMVQSSRTTGERAFSAIVPRTASTETDRCPQPEIRSSNASVSELAVRGTIAAKFALAVVQLL